VTEIGWIDDFSKSSEVDLSRAEIEIETNEATLAGWYILTLDTADRISVQLKAFIEAETATDEWRHRAGAMLARCKLAMRWIERRMLTLGFMPPYPPNDPRARDITRLTEEKRKLERKVFELENPRKDIAA
jgi:hypothetical protein